MEGGGSLKGGLGRECGVGCAVRIWQVGPSLLSTSSSNLQVKMFDVLPVNSGVPAQPKCGVTCAMTPTTNHPRECRLQM